MRDDEENYEDKEQGSEVDAHVSHAAEPRNTSSDEGKTSDEEKSVSSTKPEQL
ncbi:MAG TPA: hypothetical protein VGD78_03235 [Chthoniobacterales bacterium]